MKLGKFKVISQGLVLPLSLFPELSDKSIGADVTENLKITYSCDEDINRKTNKIDPDAKYKSMAQRHKKLFSRPIVRKIMRYKFGRKYINKYFENNFIVDIPIYDLNFLILVYHLLFEYTFLYFVLY